MEKIVTTTYKISTPEYRSCGWQGVAEMGNNEFVSFEKAALTELLCNNILRIIINDFISYDSEICETDWDEIKDNIEFLLKTDIIISELFPKVEFSNIQRNEDDEINTFSIMLSKDISPTTYEYIYLTFEY